MKLNLGNTIKYLRKNKDITQEELADILGVSYQSVSRWETGACYPDMELLPVISDFFGITVDKLLGVNEKAEQEKVKQYLNKFQEAISKGKVYDCIQIAREGIAEYPNNFALLNKLMYALFIAGDWDGNIPEWKENMEKFDAEITALGERIMKYCPDQNIRLEATARLAFNHCEMGRKEIGRSIYETLPSAKYCKENQMWWSLADDEKLPFLRNKIKQDYGALIGSIYLLEYSGCISDEESIIAIKKIFELEKLVYDNTTTPDGWSASKLQVDLARFYARFGNNPTALEHLKRGATAAKAFDNRPEEQSFSSILLGDITAKRIDFETTDTRPLAEIMRDKWLSDSDFDKLRNTDAFKEII
ncbi:MAG: helix-turn-helix domain-containing protein, partial [Eubacterium sp.]|nr:helix-turn-helix domain-containing protein [Eubacterium sp.]